MYLTSYTAQAGCMRRVNDYLKGLGVRRIDLSLSMSRTKSNEISQKLSQGPRFYRNSIITVWMCAADLRMLRIPCERTTHSEGDLGSIPSIKGV